MKIVKVAPIDGGKRTELTVSMTAKEVHLFYQALADGKLAGLGITNATLESTSDAADTRPWVEAEKDRRTNDADKPKRGRR